MRRPIQCKELCPSPVPRRNFANEIVNGFFSIKLIIVIEVIFMPLCFEYVSIRHCVYQDAAHHHLLRFSLCKSSDSFFLCGGLAKNLLGITQLRSQSQDNLTTINGIKIERSNKEHTREKDSSDRPNHDRFPFLAKNTNRINRDDSSRWATWLIRGSRWC